MGQREAEYVGPQLGDAFGGALLACWEQGTTPNEVLQLIERDDGFLDTMAASRYFAGPDDWHALDHWVCDRAQGRVLDIGSGAGRVSLYLQERGLEVTALDVSPSAGDVCRRRGIHRVFTGTVFELAQQQPDGGQRIDAFLLMGNNLGLLGGRHQAPPFLAVLASLAAPNAVILGQGMDPYRTSNELHLAYHERNRALGRLGGQIRMRERYRNQASAWFDYLFATVDELRSLLEGTDWSLEHHQPQEDGPGYVVQLRLTGDNRRQRKQAISDSRL